MCVHIFTHFFSSQHFFRFVHAVVDHSDWSHTCQRHKETEDKKFKHNFCLPILSNLILYKQFFSNLVSKRNIVSIAKSEYFCCLPISPVAFAFHAFIANGDIHSVRFPLFRRDFSYSDQLVTLYFFLYAGFLLRLWDSFILDSNGLGTI